MNQNTDTRFIKTRASINEAFLELMKEVGFSKITVKKIIDRANINRSTFYSHYLDKFDLLDQVGENLLADLRNIAFDDHIDLMANQGFNNEIFISYVNHLVHYMFANGALFTLLMSDKGDPSFTNKFKNMIKQFWLERNISDKISIPQNYAFAGVTGIMISLIEEWVEQGFRESPDEFVNIVVKIINGIPKSIFEY